jgi:hypothetical protein
LLVSSRPPLPPPRPPPQPPPRPLPPRAPPRLLLYPWLGRDEMGLPDLNSVENFAATLVVAFGGWTIGCRVSFPTVSTIGSTLGARMGCILGAFRVGSRSRPWSKYLLVRWLKDDD